MGTFLSLRPARWSQALWRKASPVKRRTLAIVAPALAMLLFVGACSDSPDNDAGPGPVGPVGPQGDIGPQGDVGSQGDVGPGGGAEKIPGSGDIVVEARDISGFERLDLAGEGRVDVSVGGDPSLTIETDSNLMEYLEVSVTGTTLTLRTVGDGAFDIDPTASIIWRVTVPTLAAVTLSGAGSVDVADLEGDRFDATVDGVGDITLPGLDVGAFAARIHGVGSIIAGGTADSVDVAVEGPGMIDFGELETANASLLINDSADITIWATDTIDISGDGPGTVALYGSPEVSGGGDLVTLLGEK